MTSTTDTGADEHIAQLATTMTTRLSTLMDAYRLSLAEDRDITWRAEEVFDRTLWLVREETTCQCWARVHNIIENGYEEIGPIRALELVVDELIAEMIGSGANDSWSGRTNDLRRVQFDTKRDWLRGRRNYLRSIR